MRELKEMTDEELTIHLNDVVRELKRKVYAEGYDNGYAIAKAEAEKDVTDNVRGNGHDRI